MSVIVEARNPQDLTASYDQIEIERNTANSESGMANITTVDIDTSTASDLSTGYTGYLDAAGTVGTHFYRFRYKDSGSGAVSSYSDIFAASGSVLQSRFRRMMKDINPNNYFFSPDDLDFFETQSVQRLWPITWMETYSDSYFVPDGVTQIFNFPVGVTRLNSLEFRDQAGQVLGKKLNWQVRGRVLLFDTAPSTDIVLRAWVEKMFLKISEVPEIWDTHILNLMRLQAYEMLEGDRSRYYKYNSIAKPEGGNLSGFNNIITRIESQIKLREAQLKRVRRPQSIKLV